MKKWEDRFGPAGKQMRSLWSIPLTPRSEKMHGKHSTQKPLELLRRIITASTIENGMVLDPFNGSGTTGIVARECGRRYLGIDMMGEYLEMTERRLFTP